MFFVQITLHMVISSSYLFFLVVTSFEPRAPLIQPNARVACFSFVRYIFNTSHEGGVYANLALSISISGLNYNSHYYSLFSTRATCK